ncbi:ribosome recycling factor [Patescibacteria group bacterium]|nr:ribosome recycling factor [Patescibacteria group bacterium]
MINIDEQKEEFEKSIDFLKKELAGIRTGRANPKIVENILVDSYGTKTQLKQLASITVPEARTLLIQPWDKNITKDIEKAINQAGIGISPVADGNNIRLTMPAMTEESRKDFVKIINEKAENSRISIRQVRDKIKEEIIKQEKNKELTEDDRYQLIKDLDELTKKYNEQVKEIADAKEKEVMSI